MRTSVVCERQAPRLEKRDVHGSMLEFLLQAPQGLVVVLELLVALLLLVWSRWLW